MLQQAVQSTPLPSTPTVQLRSVERGLWPRRTWPSGRRRARFGPSGGGGANSRHLARTMAGFLGRLCL